MKDFLTVKQFQKTDIRQIIDLTTEMKRIVNSTHKRGPQLSGRTLATLNDGFDLGQITAAQLAYQYLGGDFIHVNAEESQLVEKAQMVDNYGVSSLAVRCDKTSTLSEIAKRTSANLLNCGTRFTNPIATFSILTTLLNTCDRLTNLNVATVGNKDKSFLSELNYALRLFGANLLIYLPSGDKSATFDKNLVSFDTPQAVFSGADAIIDLGLDDGFSCLDYYGDEKGLSYAFLDRARVDAPLLNSRTFVDKKGVLTDYDFSLQNKQYVNDIAVIMAIMYLYFRN